MTIIAFAAATDITAAVPVITVEMTITAAGRALALTSEVEAGRVDKGGETARAVFPLKFPQTEAWDRSDFARSFRRHCNPTELSQRRF